MTDVPDSKLEAEFDRAMMDIFVCAKVEAGYAATVFHRMLCDHGGLDTARRLINDDKVSSVALPFGNVNASI